jgi:hypothetical protein
VSLSQTSRFSVRTIGTAIEWYDFFLYGTAAGLIFGKLFFPNSDPLTATLAAFGTYSIGFEDNPVHVIEAFGEALDLGRMGFAGVAAKATGRPPINRRSCASSPSTAISTAFSRAIGSRRRDQLASADPPLACA